MHLKTLSATWRPFSPGGDELTIKWLIGYHNNSKNHKLINSLSLWNFSSGNGLLSGSTKPLPANISVLTKKVKSYLIVPVASFTKEVNPQLAKRPLKANGHLANLELTSLVKEATGDSIW